MNWHEKLQQLLDDNHVEFGELEAVIKVEKGSVYEVKIKNLSHQIRNDRSTNP